MMTNPKSLADATAEAVNQSAGAGNMVGRDAAGRLTISVPVGEGHNSAAETACTDDRLRLLIERIERLEEEKKGIADDIRDVYGEARAVGYDAKIMRQLVRLRKMEPNDRREMETITDLYKSALGMG